MDPSRGNGQLRVTRQVPCGRGSMTGRWHPVVRRVGLAALGLLMLSACPSTASAIILGTPVSDGQYSGVGMFLPAAGHPLGTGTMVSPFVVLTAAQIFPDQSPDPSVYEFSLGPGLTAHATEIRVHPGFFAFDGVNLAFDLALVRLDEADVLAWPAFTRAAISDELPPIGTLVTGVGLGNNEPGSGSGVKRAGTFLVNAYPLGVDEFG